MVNTTRRSVGASTAPTDPFLFHAIPSSGVHVAFTSVDAGNLAFHVTGTGGGARSVVQARSRLEDAMGVPPGRTEYVTQVHSARVVPASGRGWGDTGEEVDPPEADAMVSPTGRDPLAIMVADCLPVVFISRRAEPSNATAFADEPDGESGGMAGSRPGFSGPTAVAHAGRRGLLDGILENTVERLRIDGAGRDPGDIEAWIGPGICGRCYEVPEEMKRDGAQRIPAAASTTSWGTPALDLPAGATAVLEALGVTVHRSDVCTLEDQRVFSHRREPGHGRFTGLVWRMDGEDAGQDVSEGSGRNG